MQHRSYLITIGFGDQRADLDQAMRRMLDTLAADLDPDGDHELDIDLLDADGNPLGGVCHQPKEEQAPYRTNSGRVLTEEELDALVAEAERGYDL